MPEVLEGIRVIDWTQWQLGTVATAMLGELGAEVIHIEMRLTGDNGRYLHIYGIPELPHGKNAYFETNNRGKKSLTLDLSKPEGKEIMYRLVKKSDVFVHNFRQGVPERLKMDYQTINNHNPKIIYAAACGYGPNGPAANEPGFDLVGLARGGMAGILGSLENPNLPLRGGLADQMAAVITSWGILAALLARERFGIGQKLDTSLLSGMLTLEGLYIGIGNYVFKERPPEIPSNLPPRKRAPNPLWNYYKCKDGLWICLGNLQPDLKWPLICKALGIEHLENDPRYKDAAAREATCESLIEIMDGIFLTRTCEEWMKQMKATGDIVCSPVQDLFDIRTDPQIWANKYFIETEHSVLGKVRARGSPVEFSKTPANIKVDAPELGQHTEEILNETLGYTWEEINELREKEII